MAQRRKRRSKAEIDAEKQAKAAAAAEAKEMEAQGFEKLRHRDEKGHYVKDDPNTPENEAWDWVKKDEEEDLEKAIELNFGSSYEKDIDEIIEEKEEPRKSTYGKPRPVGRNTQWQTVEHATCRFKERRGRKRGRW